VPNVASFSSQWFSADTLVFFTNKTDRHHITEKPEKMSNMGTSQKNWVFLLLIKVVYMPSI
jgi:hypothetical protein